MQVKEAVGWRFICELFVVTVQSQSELARHLDSLETGAGAGVERGCQSVGLHQPDNTFEPEVQLLHYCALIGREFYSDEMITQLCYAKSLMP